MQTICNLWNSIRFVFKWGWPSERRVSPFTIMKALAKSSTLHIDPAGRLVLLVFGEKYEVDGVAKNTKYLIFSPKSSKISK